MKLIKSQTGQKRLINELINFKRLLFFVIEKSPITRASYIMSAGKIILILVIIAAVAAFFYFDLSQYLAFDYIKSQQQALQDYYQASPVQTMLIFFVIYIVATGLSLPGAAILTLVGGFIFGLVIGTLLVSFASTIGATLAFLVSRLLLGDSIQEKFGDKLQKFNEGIEKEGAFYLFSLRLVPIFPFFVINLVMGLTQIRVWTFFFVSQVGMLAGTIVYVNAGTQLAQLESAAGILSFPIIISFVLLGIFPIVAKKIIEAIKKK